MLLTQHHKTTTAKEKTLDENRKHKNPLGKKRVRLDMLQDLLKKEIPKVADKLASAKEYTKGFSNQVNNINSSKYQELIVI